MLNAKSVSVKSAVSVFIALSAVIHFVLSAKN